MTLEKRAKESQRHHFDESRETFNREHDNFREWCYGYCQGATEQSKIDIDKACEWLISELGDTKLAYPRPELDGEWAACFVEDFIDNFRKAMSEL